MLLHTLHPDRWFPWTDSLARGLHGAGLGVGRADGSGAGYLAYSEGVRSYLAREDLSPHLADAALTREALGAGNEAEDEGSTAEARFGPEGFAPKRAPARSGSSPTVKPMTARSARR